ncbi:MAG: cation:proton antiporter, partial [Acidobacteriota bacterium]
MPDLSLLIAAAAPPFLFEAVCLIAIGAFIAYLCSRLGLVPIVGFLAAGVVIGPNALGLVTNQALVDQAAELGVMLLLFTIGIEFSLERLAKIKGLIFGGGGLQVFFATAITAGAVMLFGGTWQAGIFSGFLVALSSTAIVTKLLGDRGETREPHGRLGVAMLIFQDLGIIAMVLLLPSLAGAAGGAGEVAKALASAGALIVAVVVVARRVMPPVLERVARTCSPEVFLLTVIAICLGTAYLTSLAGVSVSLGAFLAGLVVSE